MKVWRYHKWDGSQEEFSLDAKKALDAMTDLMMEGLTAEEALEWMRQHGFEMAGMNFRVMGLEELQNERSMGALVLREKLRELPRSPKLRDLAARELVAPRIVDLALTLAGAK